MNNITPYLNYLVITAGIWAIGNGLLHDVFVLLAHKGEYDRNLLRLLMDGHIMLICGTIYVVAFSLLRQNHPVGIYICIIISISMLLYCGLIFPFLKSYLTIAMNLAVLVLSFTKLSNNL